MPVAVVMDFAEGTLEQYDQVIEKMGFRRGGRGAPKGLFHWVAKTDEGIRVIDVWETKEDFERFATEKIGPLSQEAGMSGPRMSFHAVHNYLTAG